MIGEPWLARLDYETQGGKEVLLSYEDENETLFGLLRLRINNELSPEPSSFEREKKAMVRELHIFGPEVPLGGRVAQAPQHHGLGEKLLREAERIAREEFKADRLSVLSGVGAREYYRSLGYSLEGAYMVKELRS